MPNWLHREEDVMYDRVVAALVAVVLLLFSAASALACSECADGTVQCLVNLELQAEEVLSTDLEPAIQDGVVIVAPGIYANDHRIICEVLAQEAEALVTEATGASGVQTASRSAISDNDLDDTSDRIEATARTGRFTGATA
jgi:hypothetical protein